MDPFIGEIRAFSFTYAPYGWSTCEGQTLQVRQNSALFAVIGNAYGGDGQNTFCLPNLSGRAPMAAGSGPGLTPRTVAQQLGNATVPLAANNYPPHNHGFSVVSNANAGATAAANDYLSKGNAVVGGKPKVITSYGATLASPVQLAADAVQLAGTATGQVSHNNMQPYLPVMLCIAVMGIFPARQ